MKSQDVIHFALEVQSLLDEVGASNLNNAITKVKSDKRKTELLQERLDKLVEASGADNWQNALRKVSSLVKRETQTLPKWVYSVPPSWFDSEKLHPKDFKKWLRFCQEQFSTILLEMEEEEKLFPDFDKEEQIENARIRFMTTLPWEFIDGCSEFCQAAYETEEVAEMFSLV